MEAMFVAYTATSSLAGTLSAGIYPIDSEKKKHNPNWEKELVLEAFENEYGGIEVEDQVGTKVSKEILFGVMFEEAPLEGKCWSIETLPAKITDDGWSFAELCEKICEKRGWKVTHWG